MVALQNPAGGSERRIALFKPASVADERVTHAMQLLDSILWAFQGTTRSTWKVTSADVADVVVIYAEDYDARIDGWRNSGKIVVEIATEGLADPAVQNRLVYPFRAQQVLVLLERLDALLDPGAGPAVGAAQSTAPTDPWAFVEALRTLRSVQNSQTWLVGRNGRAPVLWLRGDAVSYATDGATVQAIRRGTLTLSTISLQKSADPTGGPTQRSGLELSWFAGYYASAQLAPAVKAGARHRMSQWPNFGLIRPLPPQLRVAAGLSAAAADLEEIIARAKVTSEEAIRTLNALYACDVLIAAAEPSGKATPAVAATSAAQPRGGFTSFLSRMRKHLGLGV